MKTIVLAICIVATLLGLGVWQLKRAEWKHALVTQVEERQKAAPVETIAGDPATLEYRRAILTGTTNRSAGYMLVAKTYKGEAGNHWIIPMVMPTDGENGTVVLVDLGWVPSDFKTPLASGMNIETISGMLMTPPPKNSFTLPSNISTGKLYSIDIQSIANQMGTPVFPLVLYADKVGDAPPVGGQVLVNLPQNHMMYAAFWFFMAIVASVIFGLAHHKKTHGVKA